MMQPALINWVKNLSLRAYAFTVTILLLLSIPSALAIFPGDHVSANVTCKNTGTVTMGVTARVLSAGGLDVSPELQDLGQLSPGASKTVVFTITVPDNSSPGTYKVTFECDGVELIENGERVSLGQTSVNVTVESLHGTGIPFLPCIIATATYGSPLAPEVQFLREFRDQYVMNTFSGRSFMSAFNSFYYSFSPEVASWIRTNAALRQIMQTMLRPLLAILFLAHFVDLQVYQVDSEGAVMFSGLIASSLIGLVYFSPVPALLAWKSRVYRRTFSSSRMMRIRIMFLSCLIGSVILATIIRSPALASVTTFAASAAITLYAALLPTLLWIKIRNH